MDELVRTSFQIIAAVGGARSSYVEAVAAAKAGDFERADELMKAVALFEDEIPRQPGGPASVGEVAELHQRLLKATRCGVGLERVLFGVPVPHGAVKLHVRG